MGTGRTFNKAPISRPKKSEGERARRVATQRKRLVASGMDEETVRKLNTKELRALLRETAKGEAKAARA
jgi:hypothetical protein